MSIPEDETSRPEMVDISSSSGDRGVDGGKVEEKQPVMTVIAKKKAVINMKNEDNQCFKWCITRALNPVQKNDERIDKKLRVQSEKINWEGIKFPVELKDIKTFENKNEIAVNVFGYEGVIYPLRILKGDAKKHIITLKVVNLLIADKEKKHYWLIINMSRLLSSQVSKHDGTKEFCLRCLNHFSTKEKLKIHEEYCLNNEAVKIQMPEKGSVINFKNHNSFTRVPFITCADFESLVEPVNGCEPDQNKSFTNQCQKHKPNGFCYRIKSFHNKLYPSKTAHCRMKSEAGEDENVGQIFVDKLEEDIKKIHKEFEFSKKMILTEEDWAEFRKATKCWICNEPFDEKDEIQNHINMRYSVKPLIRQL